MVVGLGNKENASIKELWWKNCCCDWRGFWSLKRQVQALQEEPHRGADIRARDETKDEFEEGWFEEEKEVAKNHDRLGSRGPFPRLERDQRSRYPSFWEILIEKIWLIGYPCYLLVWVPSVLVFILVWCGCDLRFSQNRQRIDIFSQYLHMHGSTLNPESVIWVLHSIFEEKFWMAFLGRCHSLG